MKSIVRKENFKEGLLAAERAVSKSASLPILGNVLLSVRDNFLELAATDLEIGIRYYVLARNESTGQIVVPARILSQLTPLLPGDSVSLEQKGNQLQVVSGDYSVGIKTLSPDEFPLIPSTKEGDRFQEVEVQEFCRAISQVMGMAGQSQARPEIGGVYIVFGKDAIKVVATDSFRLGECTIATKGSKQEESLILPQKSARELVAVLGEKTGMMKVFLSPAQAVFEYAPTEDLSQPHTHIVSRIIEGEYPRYQDIIPSRYQLKATVDKSELLNHLRAASIFAGKTNEVRLSFLTDNGGVGIAAQSSDVGEHSSFLAAELEGEDIGVAFNWRFFIDGLAPIKGDKVVLGVSGEEGPTAVMPLGQEGYLYIVMPIKA